MLSFPRITAAFRCLDYLHRVQKLKRRDRKEKRKSYSTFDDGKTLYQGTLQESPNPASPSQPVMEPDHPVNPIKDQLDQMLNDIQVKPQVKKVTFEKEKFKMV